LKTLLEENFPIIFFWSTLFIFFVSKGFFGILPQKFFVKKFLFDFLKLRKKDVIPIFVRKKKVFSLFFFGPETLEVKKI